MKGKDAYEMAKSNSRSILDIREKLWYLRRNELHNMSLDIKFLHRKIDRVLEYLGLEVVVDDNPVKLKRKEANEEKAQ